MSIAYWKSLELFESNNLRSVSASAERETLAKIAKEESFAKERAFKPKLDMAIEKTIKIRFQNIENAMRKDSRIEILFRRAKNIAEEAASKEFAETGRKTNVVLRVSDLNEREKIILMELIKK